MTWRVVMSLEKNECLDERLGGRKQSIFSARGSAEN